MSVKNDNNGENVEEIYEDEDVLRYDADPYRKKYGDRWKKLATAIRDVPQEDGSIIREYVIEDPSLLDDLSEQEDDMSSLRANRNSNMNINKRNETNKPPTPANNNINNNLKTPTQQSAPPVPVSSQPISSPQQTIVQPLRPVTKIVKNETPKNIDKIKNELNSPTSVSQMTLNLNDKKENSVSPLKNSTTNRVNNLQSPGSIDIKSSKANFKLPVDNITKTLAENNEILNKLQNRVQENSKSFNRQISNEKIKTPITNKQPPNITSPTNSQRIANPTQNIRKPSLNEDEADKEVEIIQNSYKKTETNENILPSNSTNNNSTETIVEYEIMDEHGNLIKLEGAEQLKQLATCVKHVQDSDGSIVKEYILNDPKVIEQIKTQIKERENKSSINKDNTPNLNSPSQTTKTIPTSSSSSTSSASMSSQQHQQQQQQQQQFSTQFYQKFSENFKHKPHQNNFASNKIEATSMTQSSPQTTSNNKQYFQLPTHLQMVKLNKLNNIQTNEQNNKIQENLNYNTNNQKTSQSYRLPQEHKQDANKNQQFSNEFMPQQKQKTTSNKEPELKQIDFNKYEILTTSGKVIQFTITSGNASSSDVKEIKNAIENQILNEPGNNLTLTKTLPQSKSTQFSNTIANQTKTKIPTKSCENLTSVENTDSAFINYRNNNSQESLAKLKSNALNSSYGDINNLNENEDQSTRNNNAFKRSISLGQLTELTNYNNENENNSAMNKKNTKNLVNDPVTPEMTEQLILKLLLQQLVANQKLIKSEATTTKPTNLMTQLPPQAHPQIPTTLPLNNNNYQTTNTIYDKLLDLKDVKLPSTQLIQNNPYYSTNTNDLPYPQLFQRPYYQTNNNPNYPILFNKPLNNNNILDPYYRYNNNSYRKN